MATNPTVIELIGNNGSTLTLLPPETPNFILGGALVGPPGPPGPSGSTNGLPTGGTIGQVLTKDSNSNYDTSWESVTEAGSQATFTVSGIVKQTVYNVRDYGAVGDGVTDDTAAVQSAINAAGTAGGGVIHLPIGTYVVSTWLAILYSNIILEGEGDGALFYLADSSNCEVIRVGDAVNPYFNIHFRDFAINGNASNQQSTSGTTTGNLIRWRSDNLTSYYSTAQGIYLYNGMQNGFSVESHKYVSITDCRIANCVGQAIWNESGGYNTYGPGLFTTGNSSAVDIYGSAKISVIGLVSQSDKNGITMLDSDKVTIADNVLESTGSGFSSPGNPISLSTTDAVSIIGNKIVDAQKDGIIMYNSYGATITGNTFENNGQAATATYCDIKFSDTGSNRNTFNSIVGNTFVANEAVAVQYNIGSDFNHIHTNNIFRGNSFYGRPTAALVEDVIFSNNDFIASAYLKVPQGVSATLEPGGTLSVGTTYYYRVTANTNSGESLPGTEVSATPTSGNQSILINWASVAGVGGSNIGGGYNVYRSTTSGVYSSPALLVNTATVGYTDTGGSVGTGSPPTTPGGYTTYLSSTGNSWIAGGNVGIGFDNPTSRLHVYQNDSGAGNTAGVVIEQNGTGNSMAQFLLSGIQRFVMGLDQTDGNKFKINSGSSLSATTPAITITTSTTAGKIGVFTHAPGALLHLAAGTAAATTAPLKLTAGTNLTTPEAGAIEFDGTHFYGTVSSTRYQLDQQPGFANPMTTLGDLIYENGTPAATRLAGNTSSTLAVLTQTGTGTVSAAPAWTSSTGTGNVVLSTSPTLTTPALGTPSALTLTNATGLPVGGISATGTASSSTYLRGDGSWSTVSGGSGITRSVNSVSTATNAGSTAATDYVYLVTGTTTLTLPTAVSNTNRYSVTNVGSNTVTVATTSSQTINGSSTATLPIANMSLDFISNGSNWVVE